VLAALEPVLWELELALTLEMAVVLDQSKVTILRMKTEVQEQGKRRLAMAIDPNLPQLLHKQMNVVH
jgi:hypothetical protein